MLQAVLAAQTATRIVHDTVTVALPDSLRVLLRGPVEVNLPPSSDWKPLLPVVVGGLLAIVGGAAAQWFRLVLETRKQKEHVRRRMLYMLQQGIVIARMCRDKDQTTSVPSNWMREVLVHWAAYERIVDLTFFGADRKQMELHAFLERMRMDAETILEGEKNIRRRFDEGKETAAEVIEAFRRFNRGVANWESSGMAFIRHLVGEREFPNVEVFLDKRMKEPRPDAKP